MSKSTKMKMAGIYSSLDAATTFKPMGGVAFMMLDPKFVVTTATTIVNFTPPQHPVLISIFATMMSS